MRMLSLCFTCTFILLFQSAIAQELRGRVMGERGEAAVGVTVRFQNRANAISTNKDGSFKIMATSLPDTLEFSAVGFEPYKVVITEKNIKDPSFEVVLLNTRKSLAEVVVTESLGTGMDYAKAPSDIVYFKMGSEKKTGDGRSGTSPIILRGTTVASNGVSASRAMFLTDTNIIKREGILAKSRILTAGEVNDFNKWKMWEDFSETDFLQHSTIWDIKLKERYSVQVTDKNRNAVINEELFLLDKKNRDTVWKAFTDNTGKAELWPGLLKDNNSNSGFIITDRNGNKIDNPVSFENGINHLTIDWNCSVSRDVDIAFVVDATGSMSDEIEFLKLELEDMIRHTIDKYSKLSLRAASVFYRDTKDEYLTRKVPFSDDLLKTLNFIKLQHALGGGDYPEAVDQALQLALDSLNWNSGARAKLLFLILDAPPHKSDKERIRNQITKAAAMGVRIIPLACSGTDKGTEFLLRSMALATNGTYTFLTDQSGVGDSHIAPTTDKFEMELLNNLFQRIIAQYLYVKECNNDQQQVFEIKQPSNLLSLKLFPNPTTGRFTIETKQELKDIFITDFTGKILMRLAAADKKGRWQVNIEKYPAAMYIVKYITKENTWGAERVVLVR